MQLYSVLGNAFKLDGGAMFGNAAKAIWESWLPADEQNRISLATRALLVITQKETILFETGIGAYMDPRYRDRYGVNEPGHMLLKSLAQKGISPADITRIFCSHLHFDHAGGLLSAWQDGKEPELLFPNAKYYVGEEAWERATHPHPRDRASFIPQLQRELEQSHRLVLLKKNDVLTIEELELHFFHSDGHTPGLLCADLRFGKDRLVYASDLIPGRFWVHLPISMGYDRFPELLIDEKNALLTSLVKDDAWLFYVHDPDFAVSKVRYDDEHKTFLAVDAQKDLAIGSRKIPIMEK
ncbi:MAG: MBL fold metallo-hydrolase [Chloroflexi bacterium]|nr:MBL fold metallo-hydrolase [Chloroflexota bacterium]